MSALWAITCFFNPAGYQRRLRNYRWFRERMAAPLITVELSFNGEFELGPRDADILVQLDQGDILFQKERLLNIALARVPADCTAIAWVDGDILFGSDDWPDRTLQALERFSIVQLFSERLDLPPDSGPEAIPPRHRPCDRPSIMALVVNAGMRAADFQRDRLEERNSPGFRGVRHFGEPVHALADE